MEPLKADYLIQIENPICEWEDYQIVVHDNGTSTWWLIMKDPDTMEVVNWEEVPPIDENPYL